MDHISLKSLVGKLDDTCRGTLESAAGLCLSRTHYNVEIEHWLLKLVEVSDTDLAAFRQSGVDASRLARDLTAVIDRFEDRQLPAPALSPNVVGLINEAWMEASIGFGAALVRSGCLLCALLSDDTLSLAARGGIAGVGENFAGNAAQGLPRHDAEHRGNAARVGGGNGRSGARRHRAGPCVRRPHQNAGALISSRSI